MEEAFHRWIEATASIRSDVLTFIGLALALLLTIHVLLHKREVGAAIGRIGLVWLAPISGSTLYVLFGINRVTRRARQLDLQPSREAGAVPLQGPAVAAAFHALDHAVRQITRLPLRQGNAIRLLQNGDEAYPAMLGAIRRAQRSVALSSYIFRNDRTGGAFFEALVGARGRGVEVRVLIDGIGGGYFFHPIYRRLRAAGVPAALFMHSALPWRMPFLNLRTHTKLLIVDGATAFTGGINIADENRVGLHPPNPVRDTHFQVEGPVVEQLVGAFARSWIFATGEDLRGDRWLPSPEPAGDAMARVVTSGPDADIEKIEHVVLHALNGAHRSIRLVTPYFLPSEVLTIALSLAATRGVAVDVIIPQASNHRFVDWATRAHVGPLLDHGVRIWLNDPPFEHSKMLVVDEQWCFVGSANWDMRSFRLNFELNLEIYDSALAGQLCEAMQAKMTVRLTHRDLLDRSLPIRLRDASVRLLLPYL
ncbi:phospholipase D-like domain-containing protein [Methylorubrum extorquens]|uniref:phospholipase D-like domain-containing protein n=1 Tax=Methylorubrum extorquens TaxID=408 RepID=UPI0022378B3E|nr:phospholipase D-like domain-containing protein [Methylorubrum extorquens]UYW29551.1 phospholipase D-like domain-containing protein [Methylorubrum extorquens]